MSASVKAALAAKRAEAAKSSNNSDSTSQDESGFSITPLGSPKKQPKRDLQEELKREMQAALSIGQQSEEAALLKACTTGRLALSSRSPALSNVPSAVYSLLGEETPLWYSQGTDSPWYDRADVTTLILSTNEIVELEDKIGQFELLQRLDLHSNRLSQLPASLSHLSNLKHLVLSRNQFNEFPSSLLTLDNLVSLDLSHNNISSLWQDSDILSSRETREKWEKENSEEEGGVWAGLIAKTGSPTKKIGPPKPYERSLPLRSLRSLNLSNNKLKNSDLGMKLNIRRKGVNNQDEEVIQISLPPKLNSLDLSDNSLSGPLELKVFGNLEELKHLALGGNGISDDVFLPLESDSNLKAFNNLQNLDLSRCEIDDLSKIETFFASSRTRALGEEESSESKADAESQPIPTPSNGVPRRQLIRVPGQQPETSINPFSASKDKISELFIILERNPLREELFRRKRGPSTLASGRKVRAVSSGVTDAVNGTGRSDSPATAAADSKDSRTPPPSNEAFVDPAIASQGTARLISVGNPSLPPKPVPAKEEWEIQAEQGLMSEGAKRRMRAEAARREREASGGASESNPNSTNETSRGRGKNTTGLSDWDGEPAPTSGSRNRGRGTSSSRLANGTGNPGDTAGLEEDLDFEDEDLSNLQDGGTALSTAKLSTKKKEALGQVPCKFFRANGCSAGNSCPFAHTMPGEGAQKAVCQWFSKGSCRFGHKCALMHILPGQPISMDRKNKRAAQQAQNGKGNGNAAGGGGNRKERHDREDAQWEQQARDQQAAMQQQAGPSHFGAGGHRDHDFPFGLPDDLMAPAGSSDFNHLHQAQDLSYQYNGNANRDSSSSLHRALNSNDVNTSPSSQRPVSVPRGSTTTPGRSTAMDRGRVSMDNGVPVGSPSAFGTSPFSHPGGHSLFFSGSQDSESTGPFARMASQNIARSMGQFEDSQARARWYGASRGGKDQEESGDLNEEDFVPSSLSDLLTPAELERRGRSSRNGAPAPAPQPTTTSSMPAQGGGQGSLWDLNLRTNGAAGGGATGDDIFSTSNQSAAFLSNGRNYDDYFSPIGGASDSRAEPSAVGTGSSQLGGQAFSPGARAALHHAPGQSLPQGLAAGLSRLHLGASSGGVADAMRNANAGNGSAAIGSNSLLSVSGNQAIGRPSSGMRKDSFGNGANGNAAYDELGPIAPSSFLPHRPSPLSVAAARSQSNSYGQNFNSNSHLGSSPFSATGSASGFPSSFGNNNQDGIAIPGELSSSHSRRLNGQNGNSANVPSSPNTHLTHSGGMGMQMLGHPRKRPEMDRIRSGAPVPGSPLSYPTKEESEMEDEAIFELE